MISNQNLHSTFLAPPTEFGAIPLWFWNDDLNDAELLRQLREFHRAGFGGVVPHPRIGLSPRIGYLTDEYFRLVRLVTDEAARLGMKIVLYDEGCYPSGSACGQVVQSNPQFASQCVTLLQKDLAGPAECFWRPNTGRALLDQHICTVLARVDAAGVVDPTTLQLLEPHPHTIFHLQVPAGTYKALSVWQTASGGYVRGVFAEHESGHATAPPAGDILNPQAVAKFLELTHDRYHHHLKAHFGKTVIAMFTDEPSVLGKGARRRGIHPFTDGFAEYLSKRLGRDVRSWLPALWLDYGPQTAHFRRQFDEAVHARLRDVFYTAQSNWCRDHGIALTGHPQHPNDLSAMHVFQFPGQDVVWRAVLPNSPTAIEGDASVSPKAATSGARLHGRARILTEMSGAYGWQHTPDELKWLLDWHFVRGNNLINLHAAFYSIRDRRAWESEPDVGVHNVWWPHFQHFGMYIKRISWLLSGGEQVCEVAVLGDGHALPWAAAKRLLQTQIDFLYIDDDAAAGATVIPPTMAPSAADNVGSPEKKSLHGMRVSRIERAVSELDDHKRTVDDDMRIAVDADRKSADAIPDAAPDPRANLQLADFKGQRIGHILNKLGRITRVQVHEALKLQESSKLPLGQLLIQLGYVTHTDVQLALTLQSGHAALTVGTQAYTWIILDDAPRLSPAAQAKLDAFVSVGGRLIQHDPAAPLPANLPRDLEVMPASNDLRFLHYRKASVDFYLLVNEGENVITGELRVGAKGAMEWWDPWTGQREAASPSGAGVRLTLDRRASRVLVVNPAGAALPPAPTAARLQTMPLRDSWMVARSDGSPVQMSAAGDWARMPGFELFTGTLSYRAKLMIPPHAGELWLNLGRVGDIAEVLLDGTGVGVAMWAPYRVSLGRDLPTGEHNLEIRVTNSMANAYDGAQLPSGLMGPGALEFHAPAAAPPDLAVDRF